MDRASAGTTLKTSSRDDIPTQLAALFGYSIKRIRITDEEPPRISVIDLAAAITKKDACQAAKQVAYVKKRHPEVTEIFGDFKFRGQEQKKTPEADLRGAARLACYREVSLTCLEGTTYMSLTRACKAFQNERL